METAKARGSRADRVDRQIFAVVWEDVMRSDARRSGIVIDLLVKWVCCDV
jgi:hypothetical protein